MSENKGDARAVSAADTALAAAADVDAARLWARQQLESAGVPDAAGDARRLVDLARTGGDPEAAPGRAMTGDGGLDAAARRWLAEAVAARAGRRPVSQIAARRAFYNATFETSPDVLDPRPESEALVEAALGAWPAERAGRVVDLGVGSGCLLLSVLAERPGLTGLGVDASAAAIAVARRNADRLGVADRCAFRLGDWTTGLAERFDLILCNPPYIPLEDWRALQPEVRAYEPKAALTPGPDGLTVYRRLAGALAGVLAPGGAAFFEVGRGQAQDVAALMRATGGAVRVLPDLGGVERVVSVRFAGQGVSERDTDTTAARGLGLK